MTRPDWIEELRAGLRPADPDPVLLAQLVELSHGSVAPTARTGQSVGARLAIALGGAIAVGATSWAAGALPGTDSPFLPEEHVTHQPTDPTPGNVGTPQPDDSESPAGGQSPPPAGDSGKSTASTPGASASDEGRGHGKGPGPSGSRAPDPPGAHHVPEVPGSPDLPDVPVVPEPPGLTHVPDVPTAAPTVDPAPPVDHDHLRQPSTSPQAVRDTDQDTDSDSSGGSRAPQPREAQVAQEQ